MITLLLMRHGDAGAYTTPDHLRNLSPLGQTQAQSSAKWLTRYSIDLLISSPYNRAYQTAAIAAPSLTHVICDAITPDDDPKLGLLALAEKIDTLPEGSVVLVVCHMNIIAKMAGLLTGEPPVPFGLAEVRAYELPCVGLGVATEVASFAP